MTPTHHISELCCSHIQIGLRTIKSPLLGFPFLPICRIYNMSLSYLCNIAFVYAYVTWESLQKILKINMRLWRFQRSLLCQVLRFIQLCIPDGDSVDDLCVRWAKSKQYLQVFAIGYFSTRHFTEKKCTINHKEPLPILGLWAKHLINISML